MLASAVATYHDLLASTWADSQADLDRQTRLRGLYFGTRPVCTVLRPRFLTDGQFRFLQARVQELLVSAYDRLDYLHAHRGEVSGIRTGFADLDALTTGLQDSDLILVAARPSVGKTSFALNVAEHAAVREKKSVGIFSLEMGKEQLVLRLLSSVANVDSQRLRTGFLEEMDFTRLALCCSRSTALTMCR